MAAKYMTIATVIDKADIRICGDLRGRRNQYGFVIDGTMSAPGTVVYAGFAGAINVEDKRYYGVHRFHKGDSAEGDMIAFAEIPGIGPRRIETPFTAQESEDDE